jgi:hypothetical protein
LEEDMEEDEETKKKKTEMGEDEETAEKLQGHKNQALESALNRSLWLVSCPSHDESVSPNAATEA